jgi:hypothetical protein
MLTYLFPPCIDSCIVRSSVGNPSGLGLENGGGDGRGCCGPNSSWSDVNICGDVIVVAVVFWVVATPVTFTLYHLVAAGRQVFAVISFTPSLIEV